MGKRFWTWVIVIILILVVIGYVMLMKKSVDEDNESKINQVKDNQTTIKEIPKETETQTSENPALDALALDNSESLDDSPILSTEENIESP